MDKRTEKQPSDFRQAIMTAWVQGWYAKKARNDDGKRTTANHLAKRYPLLAAVPDAEPFFKMSAAEAILWLMKVTWAKHQDVCEPYSDEAALEIAVNELIDHARSKGLIVRCKAHKTEIPQPYGIGIEGAQGTSTEEEI
jgi:hypothetical protein